MVWESHYDSDLDQLRDPGYVPAMRGHLGLWPEVRNAEGKEF